MVGHEGKLDEVEDLGGRASLAESPPAQDRQVSLAQAAAGLEFLELFRLLHPADDLTAAVEEERMLQLDDRWGERQ